MTNNILLILAGLVGVSCFFGAVFYLMSVANEIKIVKTETPAVAEVADPIDDRQHSHEGFSPKA